VITAACLVLTALCFLTAIALFALSARHRDGFLGLAALTAMIVGAMPATVYGGLTS
jgi:hypothetical protein